MYKVYIDDKLLYDSYLELLQLHNPSLELEVNKAGSFSFTIYPDHPYFNKVQKLSPIITVKQKGFIIFRGRILDLEQRFYNEKNVLCEGELAFLTDSVQRPYDFQTGDKHTTIPELFAFFINNHNAQVDENHQFKVGKVTVSDSNNYIVRKNDDYSKTLEAIKTKLLDVYGGYLWVRHEADGNYIDYLKDFNVLSSQPVRFGKNLLDLKRFSRGADIATAIIPLGAKDTETGERVTIESVNNGVDFICDQDEVNRYKSKIFKVMYWDDVKSPDVLLKRAEDAMQEAVNVPGSVELTAVDLAAHDTEFSAFHLGTYVKTESAPHELDLTMLVTKLSIKLDSPGSNKLTLGAVFPTGSDQIIDKGSKDDWYNDIKTSVDNDIDEAISIVKKELSSSIEQSEQAIRGEVSETVKTINGRIETTEKSLAYLEEEAQKLSLGVSGIETELDNLSGDYNVLFQTVTDLTLDLDGINAVVKSHGESIGDLSSSLSLTAEAIGTKVSKDEIISSINQSAETIKIQASMIDFIIGGKNNVYGAMTVRDYDGFLISTLDMDGLKLFTDNGYLTFTNSEYEGSPGFGTAYAGKSFYNSRQMATYLINDRGSQVDLNMYTHDGNANIKALDDTTDRRTGLELNTKGVDYPYAELYSARFGYDKRCSIMVDGAKGRAFFYDNTGVNSSYLEYSEILHTENLIIEVGVDEITQDALKQQESGRWKGSYGIWRSRFNQNAVAFAVAHSGGDVITTCTRVDADGHFDVNIFRPDRGPASTSFSWMLIQTKFQVGVTP